jgi:hypothetical protein
MTTQQRNPDHLTAGQVAAMIDRRLRPAERSAAIEHLSSCLECRHELAEMQHALKAFATDPRPVRRRSLFVAGIVAAVVVAAVPMVLLSSHASVRPSSLVATRAGNVSAVDGIVPIGVIAPEEGAELAAKRQVIWHPAGQGASYLVTLQDTAGVVIWSSSLTDTSATIPLGVRLVPSRRYFWSVDARLADGVSTSTGVHVFKVP